MNRSPVIVTIQVLLLVVLVTELAGHLLAAVAIAVILSVAYRVIARRHV